MVLGLGLSLFGAVLLFPVLSTLCQLSFREVVCSPWAPQDRLALSLINCEAFSRSCHLRASVSTIKGERLNRPFLKVLFD